MLTRDLSAIANVLVTALTELRSRTYAAAARGWSDYKIRLQSDPACLYSSVACRLHKTLSFRTYTQIASDYAQHDCLEPCPRFQSVASKDGGGGGLAYVE